MMNEFIIIGSGFSGFLSYLQLERFNPILISTSNKINKTLHFERRNNLKINKLFSEVTNSYGTLKYNLLSETKLHDRNSYGGNSNIWGGFINIDDLNSEFTKLSNKYEFKLLKLQLHKNGYSSNCHNIRQIRTKGQSILNTKDYLKNIYEGFLDSFKIEKNSISLNVYDNKTKLNIIKTKKLVLCINLPQLIDILYRSKLLANKSKLLVSEFKHDFKLSLKRNFINHNFLNNLIIKYDFIRTFKHYYGYQKSLDKFLFKTPIYIDQHFFNKKLFLKLELINNKIVQKSNNIKFGDSIHYCDLKINNTKAISYIQEISKNLFGFSTPFVEQKLPGPISNDIVNNFYSVIN